MNEKNIATCAQIHLSRILLEMWKYMTLEFLLENKSIKSNPTLMKRPEEISNDKTQ